MSQVSSGTSVGAYFMKWEHEDKEGFVREHEGHFVVCLPSRAVPVLFTLEGERLYLVEADCIDRESAEYLLEYLKKHRRPPIYPTGFQPSKAEHGR
jgi:hypothetical protein